MPRKQLPGISVVILILLYVGSYVALSRMGIQQAAQQDSESYYFVEPTSEGRINSHLICCMIYMPLIMTEVYSGAKFRPDTRCHLSLS